MLPDDQVTIDWDETINPDDVRALGGIVFQVQRVNYWGERVTPQPQTAIYQDGPERYSTFWRATKNGTPGERVGIYLGRNLVAVVTTDK